MESTTFSSLRSTVLTYDQLARYRYPEECTDIELIRFAFDAANRKPEEINVFHIRATKALADRFAEGKMNTNMWEAAEALRELRLTHPEVIGENAEEALSFFGDRMEVKSVNSLAIIVITGTLHNDEEKIADAIRLLGDHYVRGRFIYDDEEHFALLLYKCLRDERSPKILLEVASALELFPNKETLGKVQGALRNRSWSEAPEMRRRLVSLERTLCARLREAPLELAHHFANTRRSAPPVHTAEAAELGHTAIISRRAARA